MRIVLRNEGRGRRDAVYVLAAVGFGNRVNQESEYWLTAYWGKWEKFLIWRGTLSGLQSQEKYHGRAKAPLMVKVQKLVAEKIGKGYRVVEERSSLPEWPILPFGQNWRDNAYSKV